MTDGGLTNFHASVNFINDTNVLTLTISHQRKHANLVVDVTTAKEALIYVTCLSNLMVEILYVLHIYLATVTILKHADVKSLYIVVVEEMKTALVHLPCVKDDVETVRVNEQLSVTNQQMRVDVMIK